MNFGDCRRGHGSVFSHGRWKGRKVGARGQPPVRGGTCRVGAVVAGAGVVWVLPCSCCLDGGCAGFCMRWCPSRSPRDGRAVGGGCAGDVWVATTTCGGRERSSVRVDGEDSAAGVCAALRVCGLDLLCWILLHRAAPCVNALRPPTRLPSFEPHRGVTGVVVIMATVSAPSTGLLGSGHPRQCVQSVCPERGTWAVHRSGS